MFIEKNFASGVESATFASAKVSKKNWTNQEGFLRVQRSGAFRGKNLAETRSFWLMGSEWKIAGFFLKHFRRSCQHRIPFVQRNALRQKGFFSKNYKFDILFWFWMKKFRIYGRRFRQGCQKQNPCDQKKKLINFLWKKVQLSILWWFSWGNADLQEAASSSVRHSSRPVEHSKGLISGSNKTFIFFGHWARIFWVSGRTKLADLPKLHSMWPEQILE